MDDGNIRGSHDDDIKYRVAAARTAAALLEEFLLRLLNAVAGSAACNLLTSIYNGERVAAFYTVQHHITSKGTLSIFVIKKVSPPRTRRGRFTRICIAYTPASNIGVHSCAQYAENPFSPSLSVTQVGTLHLFFFQPSTRVPLYTKKQ